MDIIENIKGTITETGKKAVKKTKELAEIAKLTSEIEDTKKLINDVFSEMGKKYFELYGNKEIDAEFSVNIATVKNLTERIEALSKERMQLRGMKMCSKCGKGIKDDFEFCPYCGTTLARDEGKAEKEEEDESAE